MALDGVLDAILAVVTLNLRATAILFTRFHPLGKRYLNCIYGSVALYIGGILLRLILPLGPARSLKRRHPVLILLLGCFDRTLPLASFSTVLLNLLLLGAVWDFLYRGHFAHQSNELFFSWLGYVDETTARIVVRSPISPVTYVEITWNPSRSGDELPRSTTISVAESNDYVGTFSLEGLEPDTEYTYGTNASYLGVFRTAAASPKRWSLVSTSCIKPFYRAHHKAIKSTLRLELICLTSLGHKID
ncbi:hypothetical protein CDEST_02071 [Colletotrichum destructivum]|uniref:Fibronectin type-III domain-containing protein n=1 Tax=Colletotrichum destructivum TaxID=34406 RepID=A0AAX4I1T5_9PEZI|nr:hypothetical protein CDEST_02071 [Colletotrichum destructivum]